MVTIELTDREVAILGALLRRSAKWDTPSELTRFVHVASEHVRDGWTDTEVDALEAKLVTQWLEKK